MSSRSRRAATKRPPDPSAEPPRETLLAALAERDKAIAQQTAAAEILRVISQSPTDARPVFERIVLIAARLLRCDMVFVLLRDGDAYTHTAGATPAGPMTDLAPEQVPIDPNANFPSRVFLAKATLHLPDWSLIDLPEHERRIHEMFGVSSALYLPLTRGDECIGVLALAGRRTNMFGPNEIAQAESFRDQAQIAMENARLFRETQEALERQTATGGVLSVIGESVSNAAPVFEAILDACQRLFGSDEVGIYAIGDDELVRVAAWRGPRGEEVRHDVTPLAESVTGRIIRERRAHHIPDLRAEPNLSPLVRDRVERLGSASLLYAPMLWEDRGLGSILVVRSPPRPFSDREQALLQTFADQAAIAVENARLFRETQEALQRQTATSDVLRVIASSPTDVQPVFDAIATSANALISGFSTTVLRYVGDALHLVAFTPTNPPADAALVSSFPRKLTEIPPVDLVRDGETTQITDTESEGAPRWNRDLARLRGYRSILFAPLMSNGAAIGMISVTRNEPGPFAAHHAQLLRTFADQAVIAINNVGLFNETQEALRQQTATSDILRVIASSPGDMQPVLDRLAETTCSLCEAYDALVLLRDGDDLRFAAHYGPIPLPANFVKRPISRDWPPGRAVADRSPVHVHDLAAAADEYPVAVSFSKEASRAATPGLAWRTALATPLMREGEAVGAIVLRRAEVWPFSDAQIALLQTFADQAVIAIENARLFDEVQARTRDLTEALQQQTATADVLKAISRTAFDLDMVLETLISTAVRLCNAKHGQIFRRHGDVYRYAASQMDVDPAYRQHEQTARSDQAAGL